MKKHCINKLCGLFLVLFGFLSILPADELKIGSVSYIEPDYGNKETFNIKYETDKDIFYIQTSDWLNTAWIELSRDQFTNLQATLHKALDWCKIAHDNNSEIKKELPNSKIISDVYWVSASDDWYSNPSYDKLNISIHFVSIAENNRIEPFLVMAAPKISSYENEFMDYSFPEMLIPEVYLQGFINVVSNENIDAVIEKHKKSKSAEELFN